MMSLALPQKGSEGLHILCLGAHSDDIEIGCGASLLRLFSEQKIASVEWVVFSADEKRAAEARLSADQFLEKVANKTVTVYDFRDGYLPTQWAQVKDIFEGIKKKTQPDMIFTHFRHDLHQDHRLLHELTWNTFRNHFILEYEIPKYDGDLKQPNFYIPVDRQVVDLKKRILLNSFQSQISKHWFDDSLLTALMRLRGVESASPSGYAEAFHVRKVVI